MATSYFRGFGIALEHISLNIILLRNSIISFQKADPVAQNLFEFLL
jgi:hypothetical protein